MLPEFVKMLRKLADDGFIKNLSFVDEMIQAIQFGFPSLED